ncbi:Growth hormone-regulated TBC protein 1 [Phytophthora cinnamomi]|uniref:Growth hormone-regulated TBC protein 1 n=1 Tax=Phytophthora cinnamomi TaxID=4785 RepID=UPI00355A0C7F|nr:Growth hormone-regulated TBC protein 1 [Phytophthora cinnamomi]
MEGVLWTREGRGKLLRGWHKRYFVLSESATLREYAADAVKTEQLPRSRRASSGASTSSSSASPGRCRRSSSSSNVNSSSSSSGMTLRRELDVRGAAVKTLPFPLVGRHNAFQLTTAAHANAVKLVLSARQADDVRQWLGAIRAAALTLTAPLSPVSCSADADSDARASDGGLESHFVDVATPQRADMARLSSVYEWLHECCVKTAQSLTVAGVHVPRGSLLVSANGVSLQTLTAVEVRKLLLESTGPLPVALRFLRSPAKCGVLRAKLYTSPLTQLKSLARYRKSSRTDWKEQVVDLSGDLLTCQLKVKTPMAIGNGKKHGSSSSSKTKRVLVLSSGSAVKPVHELVSDRKFCFIVTVQAHSMLFQARSETDRRAWTDAIQRAITIAEGLVPGGALARGSFDLDALQLQSSMNMRHLDQAFDGMEEGNDAGDFDDEFDLSDEDVEGELSPMDAAQSYPSAEDWASATQAAAYLPDGELSEMLRVLQTSGRFIEALQLMQKNTTLRSNYWRQIFCWALIPARSDAENKELFQQLVGTPLSEEDDLQVQKDIPRTAKWLAGSAGAPKLDESERADRLERLEHVLHGFLSSCSLDVRTDEDPVSPSWTSSPPSSPSFYMQGMNGLAFILLEVLENDEVEAFRFLRGIVARILPHVFGICCEGTGRDHFDLFRSLVEVGDVLQEVARLHLPNFHAALENAGLPVCLLAYKWFPTLFSDVTLTASHSQLRFDTLLCCWDVCLLLGLEGMFCVALALCSAAEDDVLALAACGEAVSHSAEQVSATVGRSLALLSPEDLVTSVCEVLELCSHPVLLKLRNAHRRRLKLGYSKVGNGFAASGTRSSPDRTVAKTPSTPPPPMTVTDLDSGKVFKISNSGNMLLPTGTAPQ